MKLFLISLILVAGCLPTEEPFNRLESNDELRMSCPGMTNSDIETMISLAEGDRQNGWIYADELGVVMATCADYECVVCLTAIVDQVYGY